MARIFKSLTSVLLAITMLRGLLMAQQSDSIILSGKIRWRNEAIAGYPAELKIISTSKQEYSCSIDSTGNYSYRLPAGSYTILPKLYYHWNGDDFIRIDVQRSQVAINTANGNYNNAVLVLDTIGSPMLLPATGITVHFNAANARKLDEFIHKQMQYYEIPGASLAIIKNGKLIYQQVYGVSNMETGTPVTLHTLFESGSVTKTVFAFVVMRLVEKKLLELDQPLCHLLPFNALENDERYKLITARHVLSHQTGLPNWAKPDSSGHFNLLFAPGTKYGYSGEGYEYLKRVVEQVTQKTISQVLKEELIDPLHLDGFYFNGTDYLKVNAANGHVDGKPKAIRYIDKPMMAFSMFTEARAFSKFMLALRNKKGLTLKSYEEMLHIQSTREKGVHWGLGFEINDAPGDTSYGHSGGTSSGFICNFRYWPERDIGYAFFTNSEMGADLALPLLTQFIVTGKKK